MEAMFDAFPDEHKEQICTNIMYPQHNELLKEIRTRGMMNHMLYILSMLDNLPLCDILSIYNRTVKKF